MAPTSPQPTTPDPHDRHRLASAGAEAYPAAPAAGEPGYDNSQPGAAERDVFHISGYSNAALRAPQKGASSAPPRLPQGLRSSSNRRFP